jgi:hypothetical protein
MSVKYYLPWEDITNSIEACHADEEDELLFVRYELGINKKHYLNSLNIWFDRKDKCWYNSLLDSGYACKEGAMHTADDFLLKQGHILLPKERVKKLEILK